MGNIRKELYKRKDLHNLIINETLFCNQDTDVSTRITYIINGLTQMNMCLECNTLINDGGKKTFCSFSCRAKSQSKNSDIIRKRAVSSSLTYAQKSDEEKNKIKYNRKKTMRKKYGVEHNFNIEGFKEKRAQTWLNNYGNYVAQRSEIVKDKTKKTCEEKYGGPNPLSDPIIKQKWLSSFCQKHGVTNPMYVDAIKRKAFAARYKIPFEEVEFVFEKIMSKESLTIDEYVILVRILTEETLHQHGSQKFGNDWKHIRGKYKHHVDHCLSIRTGYINGIDPIIIAHIENLDLIPHNENLSKGAKDTLSIEELQNKINEYEKTKTA